MGAFEDNSGKVSATVFKEDLLPGCGADRPEVLCGPAFGVDTAIIDLGGGEALAVSSDPLSLIPSLGMKVSAWLSIHLLVNDMSTTGFAPQYAQFVLNLPVSLTREQFNEYWQHINTLCKELGIAITGGHTGQIPGQESTISGGGTMFLKAPKDQLLSSSGAQAGDIVIVTKHAALSSTAILAMAFPETVKVKCGEEVQQDIANRFWNLSVLKEAQLAAKILKPKAELRAMHDVTEGGILGALSEMADAANCGFTAQQDRLPIDASVQQVADLFEIDPFISVGAGAMLIAVKPGTEEQLIEGLAAEGVPATAVGQLTTDGNKTLIDTDGEKKPFVFDGVDPYWGAFFKAFQAGWK